MVTPRPATPSPARAERDAALPTVFGPTDVDPATLGPVTPERLEVATTTDGPTARVTVRGELLQETVTRFDDAVGALPDDRAVAEIVVDLSGTTFMDSTGLGALVTFRNRVLVRGGRFAVVRPDDRVFRLFELTRLDGVFDFVPAG